MLLRSAVTLLSMGIAGIAVAQNYPNKPIHMITAEPGGGTDVVARLIAQGLTASLGQQVVVDNRAGASGLIAAQAVMKAAPDGYTLLLYSGNLWLLPFLRSNVTLDPLRDFAPVTVVASSPNMLVVHPSLPVKSVKDLIALAKARPGDLSYSSGGVGTTLHLSAELFRSMARVNMLHVPYKSGGAALTALLGGEVQVMFPVAAAALASVKSGRIRGIAVTSAQPSLLAPGLPTVAAAGLQGYASELSVGLFGPAGMPPAIVNRLYQETARILGQPEIKEKFLAVGVEPVASTTEQLVTSVKADIAKWGKLIKDAGIHAD